MKVPKQVRTYCRKCKKHTNHKVVQAKTKPRPKTKKHGLKWGVRQMARVISGYGGFPRPKIAKKAKTSTHPVFKYTCEVCKKSIVRSFTRAKKVSQV